MSRHIVWILCLGYGLAVLPAQANPCLGRGHGPYYIYFNIGSARLSDADEAYVQKIADEAKKNLARQVCVIGHASLRGDAAYQTKLSRNRADTVRNILMREGIMHSRIYVNAAAEENTSGFFGWLNNGPSEDRRVEIFFAE